MVPHTQTRSDTRYTVTHTPEQEKKKLLESFSLFQEPLAHSTPWLGIKVAKHDEPSNKGKKTLEVTAQGGKKKSAFFYPFAV